MTNTRRTSAALRIGDAERERAVSELGRHYADGRLTSVEHEERTTAALSAKTGADLDVLFADLPIVEEHGERSPAAGRHRAGRGMLGIACGALVVLLALHVAPAILTVLVVFLAVRALFGWSGRQHHRRHDPGQCGWS